MEKEKFERLVIRSLEGDLSLQEQQELETYVEASKAAKDHYESYKSLFLIFEAPGEVAPSAKLDEAFYAALEAEVEEQKPKVYSLSAHWKRYLTIAASFLIFVLGFRTGHMFDDSKDEFQNKIERLSSEVKETKTHLILALLKASSASDRIEAIDMVAQVGEKEEVVPALLHAAIKDQNPNVRQNAVYALGAFARQEEVQQVLATALEQETDLAVQYALIEVLAHWKVKSALPRMRELMLNKDHPSIIHRKAAEGINKII
ncbi:HEAT repeat domain-containing protein [Persicobacter diffluens]|uniref:HEAT repeat domain-containing protein n=1 Tax=Persicobacter diffluens TaxID=981 RepID=A0AAN4VYL9_9BACT|nr:hypothetical protein PEDI_24040 [Persicobacter diffluens]